MTVNQAVLDAILKRNSSSKLAEPAPSDAELAVLMQAAGRAPDHARLQPWRFLAIQGEGRSALGQLFADVQQEDTGQVLSDDKRRDIATKPLRAPLILAPIAHIQDHPKVPEVEQVMSVACACQNVLLAAEAMGYAGIWRTGPMAFDARVHVGLGLAENEQLLGFLYLGTRAASEKSLPEIATSSLLRQWP
ncbi:Putative NAD(P)H nitroreductase YdjA [BD1-7 clade bacterium]|uniref:Putative NAD(P)H nitroreductase n=1 Tax=BD1-7 clade bacterium TaxID=2029982 RepID=A0A5S9QEM0_9GAMM|nr:Putative NAD(P)H nitroreductase YdjA [BD1-7 clade bacterium]CAA0116932.1 Putative NAD(P)H nitroreductase YdjA [BD1-7 clade bacterium]